MIGALVPLDQWIHFRRNICRKPWFEKPPPKKNWVSWIFFPNQFRQQEPCLERIRAAMPDHLDRSYMGRQWRQPLFPHGAGCRGLWRPKLSLHRFWRPLRRLGDGDGPRSSWRLGHLGLQKNQGGAKRDRWDPFSLKHDFKPCFAVASFWPMRVKKAKVKETATFS